MGTSSDDTNTENITIAPPTEDQLVGTWKQSYTDSDGWEYISQITIDADGNWVELEDEFHPDYGHDYYAYRGTGSLDSQGKLTIITTDYAYPESFSLQDLTWYTLDHPYTSTGPVVIVDGKLYMEDFFFAEGTTSGIVGTWSIEMSETEWDDMEGDYVTTYTKILLEFEGNGNLSVTISTGTTPDYGLSLSLPGTYTYSNGTLTTTIEEETSSVKVMLYDNVLIMGDETSASANAYIKQP